MKESAKGGNMADIILTIPDNKIQLVLDAFASMKGWENSGETKAQFAKKMVANYIKSVVSSYERQQLENTFSGSDIIIS